MSDQPSLTMRLCRQALAAAMILLATPGVAAPPDGGRILQDSETSPPPFIFVSNETKPQEADIDMFAYMTGKCSTLKVAGRDFACRAVAYFHSQQGRANFTIALDDPSDNSHIISFSGENARREQDDLYELSVDRMLLNSKNRPKVDGLPVPSAELSAGSCKQIGSFAAARISSISCSATDKDGTKYELQFESDGSPMIVRTIKQGPPTEKKRRARLNERLECRNKADVAKVLPRDLTAYIIRCLAEDSSQKPATDEPQ
jgi:hypothetical protein